MELKVLEPEDKKLKKKCCKVKDFDNPSYQEIIDAMHQYCIDHEMYACAAPQFGILRRFILVITVDEIDYTDKEKNRKEFVSNVYFNPKITSMEGSQVYYEGCASVAYGTLGKVERPYKIKLEYQDINGQSHTREVEGFEAIVICHETDHLDGIEFTDRTTEILYDLETEDRKKVRIDDPHKIINKKGKFTYKTMNKS